MGLGDHVIGGATSAERANEFSEGGRCVSVKIPLTVDFRRNPVLRAHCDALRIERVIDKRAAATHWPTDTISRRGRSTTLSFAALIWGARIAICGTASYASWDPWNEGPRPERHLLVKRAIIKGFLTTDFAPRYEEGVAALAGWIRVGRLKYREDVLEGIEAAPASIAMLYAGENRGKLIIRL
jgi:hypothetical protein